MTASPATNEAGIIVTSSASRFARAVSIFPYCRIAAFHRSRLSLSPTGGSTSLGEKIESQDSWYECQSSSHVKLADGRGVPAAAAAANCSAEKRGIDSKIPNGPGASALFRPSAWGWAPLRRGPLLSPLLFANLQG